MNCHCPNTSGANCTHDIDGATKIFKTRAGLQCVLCKTLLFLSFSYFLLCDSPLSLRVNLLLFCSLTTIKSLSHPFTSSSSPPSYTQIRKEFSVPSPNFPFLALAASPHCRSPLAVFLPALIFCRLLIMLESPLGLSRSVHVCVSHLFLLESLFPF